MNDMLLALLLAFGITTLVYIVRMINDDKTKTE